MPLSLDEAWPFAPDETPSAPVYGPAPKPASQPFASARRATETSADAAAALAEELAELRAGAERRHTALVLVGTLLFAAILLRLDTLQCRLRRAGVPR